MHRKAFLIIMAGLLSSRGLFAEEQAKTFMGQEMVVTATKTENKRQDIANAVIIFDQKEINASGAHTVGELIANKTGIDLGSYGNYGGAVQEIHIRGMNADGTQVFVDGVLQNSASLGTADVARIPLVNIEKIEIVKGSGSLLYGSGASGGVINIFTKNPDRKKMDLMLTAEGGTQGSYGFSFAQGMTISDELGYFLTLGKKGTEGFRDNSDLDAKDASLKLSYHKNDQLNVSLYGDFINREYGMPGVTPPAGTAPYYIAGQEYYNGEAASLLNRHEDRDGHVVLHIDGKASEQLLYRLKSDYTYSRSYNYNRDVFGYSSYKTWVTNQVGSFEGNMTFKPANGLELLLGGEYRHYENENRQIGMDAVGSEIPATETDYFHDLHSSAFYMEGQYRPVRLIKFQTGIRHEDNSMFGTKNVFRYGVVVNPTEKTSIKFNTGSHFKAPTMNDLFWPDDGYTKGNSSLRPETGWHTDITLEHELCDNVFITAGYFQWNVKNKIAWAEDSTQPAAYGYYWVPTNLDSYKADGMELSAKAGLNANLSLSLDYTLLYAVEEKAGTAKRQSMYTPRHQFRAQLIYDDKHGLTVSPSITALGRRPYYKAANPGTEADRYISSYWLLDLKVSKKISDHFSLSLSANNLLDRDYVTRLENFYDAYFHSTLSPYPGAGRSVMASVTCKY
ncbi:MAG: TonB-dependent receptor [Chlorobiaceae bacterium]|nr:TonB-dependent receptor [Chlorobiaceae bacterium]